MERPPQLGETYFRRAAMFERAFVATRHRHAPLVIPRRRWRLFPLNPAKNDCWVRVAERLDACNNCNAVSESRETGDLPPQTPPLLRQHLRYDTTISSIWRGKVCKRKRALCPPNGGGEVRASYFRSDLESLNHFFRNCIIFMSQDINCRFVTKCSIRHDR